MPTEIGLPARDRPQESGGFRVTGKMVFWATTAFFVVVVGVNVIMATLAVNTFGGLQTKAAYKLGLKYNEAIAAAQVQAKLGWQVDTVFSAAADGKRVITITTRDRDGNPLNGLSAKAHLASPTHPQDVEIDFAAAKDGVFSSTFAAPAGQWELEIRILDGTTQKYRSDNRIMLR